MAFRVVGSESPQRRNFDGLRNPHLTDEDREPGFNRLMGIYNKDRYEELPTWAGSLAHGSQGQSRAISRVHSRAPSRASLIDTVAGILTPTNALTDYCYTLVTSDVLDDSDFLSEGLPEVPRGIHGVRQPGVAKPIFRPLDEEIGGDADSNWFSGISACFILLSAVLIGLETDVKNEPDATIFYWLEHGILAFFCMELYLRIRNIGFCNFFCHQEDWTWNLFDSCIVVSGTFEAWLMPIMQLILQGFHDEEGSPEGERNEALFMVLSVGRFARLLRLARLLKLLKIVRPLYELAIGISHALQGMFWVMVLLTMALYVGAILSEWYFRSVWAVDMEERHEGGQTVSDIDGMFQSIETSMFSLFGIVNGWSFAPLTSLFERVPVFKVFFVLFYVYSAWAMLAVLSGLVSDNMIAIRNAMEREDARKDRMRKDAMAQKILELFRAADEDNSGSISREEFAALFVDPEFCKTGKRLLGKIGVDNQDLWNLFEWIDHEGTNNVSIDRFMEGFKWLSTSLCTSTLVKCHCRFHQELDHIKDSIKTTMETRFDELIPLLVSPLVKVNAIKAQFQHLDMSVLRLRDLLEKIHSYSFHAASMHDLRATESRLKAKLAQLTFRLDQMVHRERQRLGEEGTVSFASVEIAFPK